jgi:hypothetical protein
MWSLANGGEIRGSVVDSSGQPVVLSSVTITHTGGASPVALPGRTESSGAYRFLVVPAGEYDLTIRSSWFYETTIKAVRLGTEEVRIVPTIQLDFIGLADCGASEIRPLHYRLSNDAGTGSLSGIILDSQGKPIAEATVVLYTHNSGKLGTTKSGSSGGFSFKGLPPQNQYWISISAEGYFADELLGLAVQSGLDAAHTKTLESCAPGRCQPHLKSIRVFPACA